MPEDVHALIQRAYAAFNARDVDGALAAMVPDVEWANGWEGGHVRGHDAVRDYWRRQWREIDPHVEPRSIEVEDDGSVLVAVDQVVRSPAGDVLAEGRVHHRYALRDGLVARMSIVEA